MIFLFDNTKTLTGEISRSNILNHTQKSTLGGTITASVTAVFSDEIESAHYFGAKDIDDPNVFWLYRITSAKKQDGRITLTGIYLLFDELQGEVIRDIRPRDLTPGDALERILEGSAWGVGLTQTTGTASGSYYYQSRLSAFWDFLKKWKVEYRPRLTFTHGQITGRTIDLYDRVSDDYGKWYEYGDRLIDVVAETASEGIYTALIGRGKGEQVGEGYGRRITFEGVAWSEPVVKPLGQDFVALPSAIVTYGMRMGVVEFPEIEDPAALLQATYEELVDRARPRVEFSASAIETGRVELGEVVTIIRDDLGIRYKTRVFELERNFLTAKIKSFRFGDRVFASTAERIKADREETESKLREQESLMREALASIAQDYFNEDGYNYELKADNAYGLPAGYYSFDRPIDQNPTKVVYTGAGKILIADSKDSSDEWVWRTAVTPEGIVGEEIIAHSITANKLAADVGQSLDLSSNIAITSRVTKDQILYDPEIRESLKGEPGEPGEDGQDATKMWTHVKFADSASGTNMSDIPEGRLYIGIGMDKPYPTPSTNPLEYYWGTFRNSSYGVSLRDGKFAWVKFADTKTGEGMNNSPEGKRYLGIAIKTSRIEQSAPSEYEWRLMSDFQVAVQGYAPISPASGQLWLDTSQTPAVFKRWTGYEWQAETDLSQVKAILAGKVGEQDVRDLLDVLELSLTSTTQSSIDQSADAIELRISEVVSAMDAYGQNVNELSSKVDTYWRVTAEGTELGASDNPVKLVQKPDRIAFVENGLEVAYFSNWQLYVTSIHIAQEGTLQHGPVAWVFTAAGTYDMKWVG